MLFFVLGRKSAAIGIFHIHWSTTTETCCLADGAYKKTFPILADNPLLHLAGGSADNLVVCFLTRLTDNHLAVTVAVGAVENILAFFLAHLAHTHHLILVGPALEHAVVKDKQRAVEVLAGIFFHVGADPPIKLIDILESLRLQKSRRLFAAHTIGADRQHFFLLQMFELRKRLLEVAEILQLWID